MYIYIYIYTHIHTYVYVCVCIYYIHMLANIYIYIYIYTHTYIHTLANKIAFARPDFALLIGRLSAWREIGTAANCFRLAALDRDFGRAPSDGYICIYLYIYIYTHTHIYIYIYMYTVRGVYTFMVPTACFYWFLYPVPTRGAERLAECAGALGPL